MSNFPIKVGDSSGIDTYASTLISGEEQLLITRDGKQYLTKGDGTKIQVSDIIVVDTLPNSQIQANKIYILSTQNYSMNYYDASAWHTLGGNQIIPSTTSLTDITKLWLDITIPTNPILKWNNGTSWVNVNNQRNFTITPIDLTNEVTGVLPIANVNTGTLAKASDIPNVSNKLEAINIKAGTNVNLNIVGNDVTINANSIVDTANHLASEVNASNKTFYYKDTNGNVIWDSPILAPPTSSIRQLEFINLTSNVPESKDFYPVLTDVKGLTQIYEYIVGSSITELVADFTNTLISNKTNNILVDTNGVKIQDIYNKTLTINSDSLYETDDLSVFTKLSSVVEVS